MIADEGFELWDQVGLPAQLEVGLDALLERRQAPLSQPRAFRPADRVIQVGQDVRSSPEGECLPQELRLDLGGSAMRAPHEPLEAVGVEGAVLEPDPVPAAASLDRLAAECFPQLRDVHLEGGTGRLRRFVTPQLVDQPIAGDRGVRV